MTTESASRPARCSVDALHVGDTLLDSVTEARLARTWHALGASKEA
jgi:hypothetical protein